MATSNQTPAADPQAAAAATATRPETAAPAALAGWWALFVLFLAYTFSFVDRTILSLLVEPIRRDLGIDDTAVSLLQGLAFSLFYTVAGLPIAAVADRTSRKTVIAVGIALWSLATAACGFARTFTGLFLARVGVGVGEASLGPAAYSLVADLFPEQQRGRAMGIYASATNFGAGAALLIGGAIIGFAGRMEAIETAFGSFRTWQLVFIAVGLPGLVIALLALTIPERRRARRHAAAAAAPLLPFLRAHKLTVFALFTGLACCGTLAAAVQAWVPTFFIRDHGYTAPEIGRQLGLILLVAGPLGALAGGTVADALASRGVADAAPRAAMCGIAIAAIVAPLAMLAPTSGLALALISLSTFFGAFCYPCGAAALQKLSPAPLRARMTAVYLLIVALISGIVGPTSVALITDHAFGDPLRIGWSLAIVTATAGALATLLLAIGLRSFRASVADRPAA
jgi:MFS family permease